MTKKEIRIQIALGTIILAQLSKEEFAYFINLKYAIKNNVVPEVVINNLPLIKDALIQLERT